MSEAVLMCGGPADGRWVVVEDSSKDWECVTMDRIQWAPNPIDTVIPEQVRTRYRIYKEEIFYEALWVGVPVGTPDDRRAIMRTVLQRDVAQHLGAYR
jgi:hypothetical protein